LLQAADGQKTNVYDSAPQRGQNAPVAVRLHCLLMCRAPVLFIALSPLQNKKPPVAWEAVFRCFAALCPPKPLESTDNHEDDKEDENEDAACSFAHDSLFCATAKH